MVRRNSMLVAFPVRLLVTGCLALLAWPGVGVGVAYAENLDLALGDKSAQLQYITSAGGTTYGRTELSFAGLYNEKTKATLGEIGLLVVDAAGSKTPGLVIGIGPKLWFTDQAQGNAVALGLGARFRYKSSAQDRLFTRTRLFYAPSVVAFGDADSMYEFAFEFGYEMLPTADIYLGYRNIVTDYHDTDDDILDESAYFGMKLQF